MDLENRINLLVELGEYMTSDDLKWSEAKNRTFQQNAWFIPDFIRLACDQIVRQFLQRSHLEKWVQGYRVPENTFASKNIGIVMAGNIPLVGFHDFLCCFISGQKMTIKFSSKDSLLFPVLIDFLCSKNPGCSELIQSSVLLKHMDAYIATGSNNSARYFEYYFGKYPSLIRRNRTSIALLEGNESAEDLEKLADDVFLYFGLGCRNVTQIRVPENYDFIPLLNAFRKYAWMADHNKYKNNFDYQLSLAILNKQNYMSSDNLLLTENASLFSPIAVLHYTYYKSKDDQIALDDPDNLQCIVGRNFIPFGKSQEPGLKDYPDGRDTMKFLQTL